MVTHFDCQLVCLLYRLPIPARCQSHLCVHVSITKSLMLPGSSVYALANEGTASVTSRYSYLDSVLYTFGPSGEMLNRLSMPGASHSCFPQSCLFQLVISVLSVSVSISESSPRSVLMLILCFSLCLCTVSDS